MNWILTVKRLVMPILVLAWMLPLVVTNAAPLYVFLKKKLPGKIEEGDDVKWNFTKFLLDRKGNPVQRFDSAVKPAELETEIQRLLKTK